MSLNLNPDLLVSTQTSDFLSASAWQTPSLITSPCPRTTAGNSQRYWLCNKTTGESTRIVRLLRDDSERQALETYISTVFRKAHSAQLNSFLPELFKIVGTDNSIAAAVGIQRIEAEKTFLEQYLDAPIENYVSAMAGRPVSRRQMAEVGNLAATSIGCSRQLITFLVYYLIGEGFSWAVCTAANSVRAALKRSGVGFETICKADPGRLGSSQQQWGKYYDTNPSVVLIDLHKALVNIQHRFEFYAR